MLSKNRRRPSNSRSGFGILNRNANQFDFAGFGVVHFHQHISMKHLRILENLIHGIDRGALGSRRHSAISPTRPADAFSI